MTTITASKTAVSKNNNNNNNSSSAKLKQKDELAKNVAAAEEAEMKNLTRAMETMKIRTGVERLFRILGLDIKYERNIFKAIKQFSPDTFKTNGMRNLLRMIFEFYDMVCGVSVICVCECIIFVCLY